MFEEKEMHEFAIVAAAALRTRSLPFSQDVNRSMVHVSSFTRLPLLYIMPHLSLIQSVFHQPHLVHTPLNILNTPVYGVNTPTTSPS